MSKSEQTVPEKVKTIFAPFIPREGNYTAPILVYLNVVVFFLIVLTAANTMQPDNQVLINWGANYKPLTLGGEWWRILSSCFLHKGIEQLLLNMVALSYIGVLLEPHIGRLRFVVVYLLVGTVSGAGSLFWNGNIVNVGSSGAIFGMYGVILAFVTMRIITNATKSSFLISAGMFAAYYLIYGLHSVTDNAAHVSGLVGGVVVGFLLAPSMFKKNNRYIAFATTGILGYAVICILTNINILHPYDIDVYNEKMLRYETQSKLAISVMKGSGQTSKQKLLQQISEVGLYNLNNNIKLLDSCKQLILPKKLRDRNELLRRYCEIRIKKYDLTYKKIVQETGMYNSEIDIINKQLKTINNALEKE